MLTNFPPEISASILMFATTNVADYRYFRNMMIGQPALIEYYSAEWDRYDAIKRAKPVPDNRYRIRFDADLAGMSEDTPQLQVDTSMITKIARFPKSMTQLYIVNSHNRALSDGEAQYILSLYPPDNNKYKSYIASYEMVIEIRMTYISKGIDVSITINVARDMLPPTLMRIVKRIVVKSRESDKVDVSSCDLLTEISCQWGGLDTIQGIQYDKITKLTTAYDTDVSKFRNLQELYLVDHGSGFHAQDISDIPTDNLRVLRIANLHISKMPESAPKLERLNLNNCVIEGTICEFPNLVYLGTYYSEHEYIRAPNLITFAHGCLAKGSDIIIDYPLLEVLDLGLHDRYNIGELPRLTTLYVEHAIHVKTFPRLRYLSMILNKPNVVVEYQPELRSIEIKIPERRTHHENFTRCARACEDRAFGKRAHVEHPTRRGRILALEQK
jgi:hypothetical protein